MSQPTFSNVYAVAKGITSTKPFIEVFEPRAPTQYDLNYQIQQRWWDTALNQEWVLVGFETTTGTPLAIWMPISAGTGVLELTANSGGPVPPTLGNINVVGDTTTINIVGNPGTSTLTASTAGTVATSYVENAGSATPALGVLNVVGSAGITTSGAGNTVTVTAGGTLATQYTENVGTAIPVGNNLNVLGAAGITTMGAGSTVTISPGPSIATQYTEDVGTAVPAGNNLNIVGGPGIMTSGAGSTVTITATGAGFNWNFVSANQALAKEMGYFVVAPGGAVQLSLPAASNPGDTIIVALHGATSWTITQPNAGSQIRIANNLTTLGVGGSITSTAQGDTVELVCFSSNAVWHVIDYIGNITVV